MMPMTISKLARAAGVNVETIRYYQRRGLIEQPEKPAQGYRTYPPATLTRIRFIRRAQELGFSLEDIDHLLAMEDQPCAQARELAQQKLAQVQAKLHDLQQLAGALSKLVSQCEHNPDLSHCPLVQTLSKDSQLKNGD